MNCVKIKIFLYWLSGNRLLSKIFQDTNPVMVQLKKKKKSPITCKSADI